MFETSNLDDLELVNLMKKDDSKGLDELFRRYSKSLFEFGAFLTKSEEDARELVSDVFFKFWSKRKLITITSSVKAYLFTSMKNHCLNFLRKESMETLQDPSSEVFGVEDQQTADRILIQGDLDKLLNYILNILSPKQKLVFKMKRLDGLSYEEISDLLKISPNTVHRHMVAAIKKLADKYPKWESMPLVAFLLLSLFP